MTSQKQTQILCKDPKRKCIGCFKIRPKDELIKVTKNFQTKEIVINPDSKTFGRSVYICNNNDCIEQAFKKNKISKFLKSKAAISMEEILGHCKT